MNAGGIDARWRAEHPLPEIGAGMDKEERGRALVVGGSAFVPGALLLTGEALLRAGAGKVQLATVAPVAVPLGVQFPETAIIALPADVEGEIAGEALDALKDAAARCGALLLGPGMSERPQTVRLVESLVAAVGGDCAAADRRWGADRAGGTARCAGAARRTRRNHAASWRARRADRRGQGGDRTRSAGGCDRRGGAVRRGGGAQGRRRP